MSESRDSTTAAGSGLALILCLLFVPCAYFGLGAQAGRLDHGDINTDQRAVVAAREFQSLGYLRLGFMQTEDSRAAIGFEPSYYHRHPAGGSIALAFLRSRGFGYGLARLLPLFATAIGLFGFHRFLRVIVPEGPYALMGTALLAVASPYYLLADSFQFYSYALMVKGLCFWLLAAAASSSRAGRALRLFGSSLLVVICVCLLGLETMPAVGLASFVAPLFLGRGGRRARVLAAIGSAAATGLAMVVGWALRLPSMRLVYYGDLRETLERLWASVSERSLGGRLPIKHDRGYLAELALRLQDYLQLHLLLGLVGLLLLVVLWRRARSLPARGALVATTICLLAELPYFLFMRQHVYIHRHTLVHLTAGAAAAAALPWAFLTGGSGGKRLLALVTGGVVIGLVLAFSPRNTTSNLVRPVDAGYSMKIQERMAALLDGIDPGSLLLVRTRINDSWYLRSCAAQRDLLSLDLAEDGAQAYRFRDPASGKPVHATAEQIPVAAFVELAVNQGRVAYAVVDTDDPLQLQGMKPHRLLRRSGRLALFGLVAWDDDLGAPSIPIPLEDLRLARLIEPDPAKVLAGKVDYALVNRHRQGLWLHAPPRQVGPATRAVVDLSVAPRARALSGSILYEPVSGSRQASLVLEVEAVAGDEVLGKCAIELEVGSAWSPFELDLDPNRTVERLEFRLSLAEGERSNALARVVVGALSFDCRR